MRKLKTAVIEVNPHKPSTWWDAEVGRRQETLEWWAFGASSMKITFVSGATAPRSGLVEWTSPPAVTVTGTDPLVGSLPGSTHPEKGQGDYFKYTIEVVYPNGGKFTLDPMVIIQP